MSLDVKDYEEKILKHIEEAMHKLGCKVAIIDNLTYLCNSSDKGVDAGIFGPEARKGLERWPHGLCAEDET